MMLQNVLYMYIHVYNIRINHQIRFNVYVLVALILKPPGMAI